LPGHPPFPSVAPQQQKLARGENLSDVGTLHRNLVRARKAAADQLVAQFQQVDLPHGFAVHQFRSPACLRHSFDLDPSAAAHGNVDVLSRRADAHANMSGRTADAADEQDRFFHLIRRPQIGAGYSLNQGHAEAVRAPDDQVARVGNLAAGILLNAHLGDRKRAPAERKPAVDPHDGGALKPGRNRPVQILLPGNVHFVDDVAAEHQALLDGDVHGLLVDKERRRVVHLIGTHVFLVEEVDDVLLGFELHECGAVVLAKLRKRGSHVPQDEPVMSLRVSTCRAAAEHLYGREQLLVDLQPRDQPDLRIINRTGQ
jgi:hypothetical protein